MTIRYSRNILSPQNGNEQFPSDTFTVFYYGHLIYYERKLHCTTKLHLGPTIEFPFTLCISTVEFKSGPSEQLILPHSSCGFLLL